MSRHDTAAPQALPLFSQHPFGSDPALPPDPAAVAALSPELRHKFMERAAIRELDGGMPRANAEAAAWADIAIERRKERAGLPI